MDAGAPLTEEEVHIIEKSLHKITPYLNDKGRNAIAKSGVFTIDTDGEFVTTLVNHKECAFSIVDDSGIIKCGIEKTYNDGKLSFKKPISCHLYPIRVSYLSVGDALNYHNWIICKDAVTCGIAACVPIYQFLKEPIIRVYGLSFFNKLQKAEELLNKSKQ